MNGVARDVAVIIGFAESFSAPEVVWSLVDCGFRVFAFARRRSRAAIRVSRHVRIIDLTSPEEDAGATIDELASEMKRLLTHQTTRLAVLPLDDAAVWICDRIAPRQGVIMVGPGKSKVEFGLCKEEQVATARKAGFHVPDTLVVHDERDWNALTIAPPMVLKPSRAVSFRGGRLIKDRFVICRSILELKSAIRPSGFSEVTLVQQHISGVGEGLFGLASPRGVLAWSAHRRIRMMNPLGSGASACISIAADPADIAPATRLMDLISWRGPFMIELLRDSHGKAWFMEFNGRVWGSTALARRCGLEYPAWAVLEAIGEGKNIPERPQTPMGVVCRHAGRETLHALFVLRGPRSKSCNQWPTKWGTLRQLFRFRRSEHWYNWRRDDWRVFFQDFVATIGDAVSKKR